MHLNDSIMEPRAPGLRLNLPVIQEERKAAPTHDQVSGRFVDSAATVGSVAMSAKTKEARDTTPLVLECKECHCLVVESDLVAYHLVDGVLFGWCQDCFNSRPRTERTSQTIAA